MHAVVGEATYLIVGARGAVGRAAASDRVIINYWEPVGWAICALHTAKAGPDGGESRDGWYLDAGAGSAGSERWAAGLSKRMSRSLSSPDHSPGTG